MAIDQVDRTVVTQGPTAAAGQGTVRTESRRITAHDVIVRHSRVRIVVLRTRLIGSPGRTTAQWAFDISTKDWQYPSRETAR